MMILEEYYFFKPGHLCFNECHMNFFVCVCHSDNLHKISQNYICHTIILDQEAYSRRQFTLYNFQICDVADNKLCLVSE